jgi:fatty acid desaturase
VADWPFPVVNGLAVGENTGVAVVAARTERRPVSEGRRRAEKQKRPSRRPLLTSLALGALGSGIAWLFLVKAAIEFGRLARDGQGLAWAFTAAASVGATACLLLMFVLGARVLVALGLVSEYKPRRSAGRRTK